MANAPKKSASKKAAPTRRTVGQKSGQGTKRAGTRTARGATPKPTPQTAAVEAQQEALEPVTLISGRGGFQLRCGGPLPDGTYEQEWGLVFGKKGFIVADDETLEAVKKVLAGEWTDRSVSGQQFLRNARIARLQIIKHGLETPPIPAWESSAPDSRVDIALMSGNLATADDIKKAIRYEKQSPERERPGQKPRQPEPVTLAKLEALLAAQEAGVKVAGVNPSVGAAASANATGSPLQAGAQELG